MDLNVGRLVKWLRVMGYDALFVPEADDGELLRLAGEEGRIVITRDRNIMQRRGVTSGRVKALLVTSDDFRRQMQQVIEVLGLGVQNSFSLCVECNVPLRYIEKHLVKERVPQFVYGTQSHFYVCPTCDKLYWRGTHWRNMHRELAGFRGLGQWRGK